MIMAARGKGVWVLTVRAVGAWAGSSAQRSPRALHAVTGQGASGLSLSAAPPLPLAARAHAHTLSHCPILPPSRILMSRCQSAGPGHYAHWPPYRELVPLCWHKQAARLDSRKSATCQSAVFRRMKVENCRQ
ncbi:hypothetical protein XELAEV_18043714mg [Xenopus laevis]|uniref:Uncharacterized protein n=1 Tax=Xenopus laevis TaxID=8355 RepID=A0A974H2N3_XENLA|nr:hypothetical protein XELAEV_18043714mg [Xenopus laevis]